MAVSVSAGSGGTAHTATIRRRASGRKERGEQTSSREQGHYLDKYLPRGNEMIPRLASSSRALHGENHHATH